MNEIDARDVAQALSEKDQARMDSIIQDYMESKRKLAAWVLLLMAVSWLACGVLLLLAHGSHLGVLAVIALCGLLASTGTAKFLLDWHRLQKRVQLGEFPTNAKDAVRLLSYIMATAGQHAKEV